MGRVQDTTDDTSKPVKAADSTASDHLFASAYLGSGDKTTPVGDKQQQAAAEAPKDHPEGVQKNPDGSQVEFKKGPDGHVHPAKTTFTDGSSEEFTYGKDGKVMGWTAKDKAGDVTSQYTSNDGQTFINMHNLNQKLVGTPEVHDDGTAKFTDKATGNTLETRTDGKLVWNMKDQAGQMHKIVSNHDGSSVELAVAGDGKEHPVIVRHPNGVANTFEYGPDGKINGCGEYLSNGTKLFHYTTKDGSNWTDDTGKHPPLQGTAELSDDGKLAFKFPDGGSTVLNTNGSRVESHKGADGRVHTTKIIHASGTESDYEYDASGNVNGVVEYTGPPGMGGKALTHYQTSDGLNWTDKNHNAPAIRGTEHLLDNGTSVFQFKDQLNDVTLVRTTDGKVHFQDKDGSTVGNPGFSAIKE